LNKSCPRNHQEGTAVSRGGGVRFLLGESNDLGHCADNKDLAMATLFAGVTFDSINERANDFNSLWSGRLISQHLLQSGDLSPIEVRKIRMDRDLHVALLGLQSRVDLAFASFQAP
jgi:hypothetical protein